MKEAGKRRKTKNLRLLASNQWEAKYYSGLPGQAGETGATKTSSESKSFHGNSQSHQVGRQHRSRTNEQSKQVCNGNSNISYLVVICRLDAVLNVRHGSVLIIHTLPLRSPLIPCSHMAHLPSDKLKVYVHWMTSFIQPQHSQNQFFSLLGPPQDVKHIESKQIKSKHVHWGNGRQHFSWCHGFLFTHSLHFTSNKHVLWPELSFRIGCGTSQFAKVLVPA